MATQFNQDNSIEFHNSLSFAFDPDGLVVVNLDWWCMWSHCHDSCHERYHNRLNQAPSTLHADQRRRLHCGRHPTEESAGTS